MTTAKISKKITGYKVKTESTPWDAAGTSAPAVEPAKPAGMHEAISRSEVLHGSTYKVKPPHLDNALYVTINDMEIGGVRHPYEIFLNSKNMEHFQWAASLTRVISAVFRKGGDITFLADELKEVFDPRGGYFNKGKYMPSLVAEIGYAIEKHLKKTGHIIEEKDPNMEAFIAKKREEHGVTDSGYPAHATMCDKCKTKAVVKMDNCSTCLSCSDSKCN